MFDAKRLLDQFLASQGDAPVGRASDVPNAAPSNAGGLLGGALAGGLVGLIAGTKTGRKLGKAAVGYGGSALLGGLAYKAWNDWRAGRGTGAEQPALAAAAATLQPPPTGSAFLPVPGQENDLNRSLLRAMIAAAKADGHIDADEQQRIYRAVNDMQLGAEEKAFVMDELAGPADIGAVAAGATCPETAAEIYLASLFAIDPSGVAEGEYLAQLAARLELDPGLVQHLHANAGQVRA